MPGIEPLRDDQVRVFIITRTKERKGIVHYLVSVGKVTYEAKGSEDVFDIIADYL